MVKIVKFTAEPKSAEIRKQSQKAIIALFNLSATTFFQIQAKFPTADQVATERIVKMYMSELPSSGDESDREINTISPKARKNSHAKVRTACVCVCVTVLTPSTRMISSEWCEEPSSER